MKELPQRASRGKRARALLGDDLEADSLFWNQDAFQDEEDDSEFATSSEEDSEDSDIDAPEEDGQADVADAERAGDDDVGGDAARRSSKAYVDPLELRKARLARLAKKEGQAHQVPSGAADGQVAAITPAATAEARTVRQSTKEKSVLAETKRQFDTSARVATVKSEREAGHDGGEVGSASVPVLSQVDMLLESINTAVANTREVEELARFEEAKKARVVSNRMHTGRMLRYHSKRGEEDTLTFTDVDTFPEVINSVAPPAPPRARCVITGLPAKYRDPRTGQPFATIDAFRQLRRAYGY